MNLFYKLQNSASADLSMIPVLSEQDFRMAVINSATSAGRVEAFFAMPEEEKFRIFAVLLNQAEHVLEITSMKCGGSYSSLTPELPAVHLFEREIAAKYQAEYIPDMQCGILPKGRKDLWSDSNHPNSAGNRIVANTILSALKKILK